MSQIKVYGLPPGEPTVWEDLNLSLYKFSPETEAALIKELELGANVSPGTEQVVVLRFTA